MFPCHDKLAGPVKSALNTLGTVGLILAIIEVCFQRWSLVETDWQAVGLFFAFLLYSDFNQAYGERDAARMAETRRLLHEGSIPAQQFTTRA